MVVFFPLQEKWSWLVSQARPNQPQRGSLSVSHTDTESDPCWGWLGLACETGSGCAPVGECNYCYRYNMLTAAKHDVVYLLISLQ